MKVLIEKANLDTRFSSQLLLSSEIQLPEVGDIVIFWCQKNFLAQGPRSSNPIKTSKIPEPRSGKYPKYHPKTMKISKFA